MKGDYSMYDDGDRDLGRCTHDSRYMQLKLNSPDRQTMDNATIKHWINNNMNSIQAGKGILQYFKGWDPKGNR